MMFLLPLILVACNPTGEPDATCTPVDALLREDGEDYLVHPGLVGERISHRDVTDSQACSDLITANGYHHCELGSVLPTDEFLNSNEHCICYSGD